MEDKVRGKILVLRGAKREAQDCGLAALGVEDRIWDGLAAFCVDDKMWDKSLVPQRGKRGSAGLPLGRFLRGGQDVGQDFNSPEGRKGKRRIAAWPLFAWRTRCGTRF